MDLRKIIEEAEGLPDEGWNLSLLGSRISGESQQDIFSGNLKKSSPNTRKKRGSLGSYASIYINSIIILRVLSCKLYIEDPTLFLRLTKIAHVFIKYSLLNVIKEPNEILNLLPVLRGGGKTFIHGKAKKEPSTDDNLNDIILLIIKILLFLLPRENMFKQDKSLLRQLGDLQKSGVKLTDEGKLVKANFVTEYPSSVTGRPLFSTNLPFRYAANNEPPFFRGNNVRNFSGSSNAVAAFSDTARYMNVSISPEMQESFKTYIIASGVNTSLGEVGLAFKIENGFIKVLKTVRGTRGSTFLPPISNTTHLYAHFHPFRWNGPSPESQPDLTGTLRRAHRFGIFTGLVFTQEGVITMTVSNPGDFGRNSKGIQIPSILDWNYTLDGTATRTAITTIGNSSFSIDIRTISWPEIKQGTPITLALPEVKRGVPVTITPTEVDYGPENLSFLYKGRSTINVNQTEMMKWTEELFEHPNMKYFRGLLSTNMTGFHELQEQLNTQLSHYSRRHPCSLFTTHQNYAENLNQPGIDPELERCARDLYKNFSFTVFGLDHTKNEDFSRVISNNNAVQRGLRALRVNSPVNYTRRVRPGNNGVLNFTLR